VYVFRHETSLARQSERSLPHPAPSTNRPVGFGNDDPVRILVTNDDGIDSLGLHILARSLRARGEVVIAAPDTEYSGAGASLGPLHLLQPEIHRTPVDGIHEAW